MISPAAGEGRPVHNLRQLDRVGLECLLRTLPFHTATSRHLLLYLLTVIPGALLTLDIPRLAPSSSLSPRSPPQCSETTTTTTPSPCEHHMTTVNRRDLIHSSSPQGRIFQVEYAQEAVKQGSVVVGIVSKTHAVLAAIKVRIRTLPIEPTHRLT